MTQRKRGLASNPLFTKTDEPDAPGLSAKAQVRPTSPPQPEVQAASVDESMKSPSVQPEPTREPGTPGQTGEPYGRTSEPSVRADALVGQIPAAPDKRRPERYAFQFWEDQITRLKKLKQVLNVTKDPEDRDEITLSDLVRRAIDDYLDKQIERIEATARTDD